MTAPSRAALPSTLATQADATGKEPPGPAPVPKITIQPRPYRGCSPLRQLMMVLWKNIYLKRLCRHYNTTLLEIVLMVVLLLGIQEDAVVREPFIRKGDTYFAPIRPDAYWNTQPDAVLISRVLFAPVGNKYVSWLTRKALGDLGVSGITGLAAKKDLIAAMRKENSTPSRTVGLLFRDVTPTDTPVSLHISFFGGPLPYDVHVNYPQRILSQPEGPSSEERFPEMNTLLPIMHALHQRHLERQALQFKQKQRRLHNVQFQRFPYPSYIEHNDTKNYALVLTRFCIGMLVPFAVFVARLSDEKTIGMKEMLRVVGLNDWVYWVSHYISGFFMHLIIVTLMMLFMCVKRNAKGRAFIQFSDPLVLFCILMCFCSSCLMQATLLSMFFASPHSAVAGAMLYWTFSCVVPFLALEDAGGKGYQFIKRSQKLATCIFPGMSLHWSFRVLERFEKFVDFGANWVNFADRAATPDNITLAEILFVGLLCDFLIVTAVWYLDNVMPIGPGIAKPFLYPFKISYWIPTVTLLATPEREVAEAQNFEPEPRDQLVAIDLYHASKDYDGVVAVQDVSMRIFENQITVLLGHNGAGKTTLLNMITGFTSCSAGNVLVGGYDVMTCPKDARESFGYCAQDNILFDDLTVEEHLIFFAVVKGTPYSSVRLEVVTLLHEVGLMPFRTDRAVDLSLGQQRRLCTALAIVAKPRVIILDEPTANMDPESRREMWELLLKVRRTCSVFLTTQHLDEADVLADRIAIIANGRIRCTGSPAFLKQRYGTGYRMRIQKGPKCDVAGIEKLLRKHSPKARLHSDSRNEAVFMLGQIIATKLLVTLFKEIEKNSADLDIDSLGLTVTSIEDVLIRVDEEQQVQQQRKPVETQAENTAMETKEPLVALMATTVSSEPNFASRMRVLLYKKALCIWRQKKQPLFSWLLPPLLLSLLFQLENVALYHTADFVEHVGDSLSYTFIEVLHKTNGFVQVRGNADFYADYVAPLLSTERFHVDLVPPAESMAALLLASARSDLRHYVFNIHFVVQLLDENRTLLWYNGEIQHSALLTMRLYNQAHLRYVTGVEDAQLSFDVTQLDYGSNMTEDEATQSRDVYSELLPNVLRSIFLPLASSLMCSNFVLFPIAERALQVKHLHIITGVSPFLYWTSNYLWDFMFYMGTAISVLPPIAYFHSASVNFDYIQNILLMNILHGYAALPFIYICSFFFDNPENGFSALAISTFLISSVCCLGSVFMDHYASTTHNALLTVLARTVLQFARLLPNYSYSRGMTKVLQLAAENALCRMGGQALRSACHDKTERVKISLQQCCLHLDEPQPERYAISPLGMHSYSAFYEVLTLFFEGPLLFALLICADYYWLRRLDRHLSEPEPTDRLRSSGLPVVQMLNTATPAAKSAAKPEDTDVLEEAKVVDDIVTKGLQEQLPSPLTSVEGAPAAMVVYRLEKAYGYVDSNVVLQGLSFTVRTGECFGLLGANGVGKTTTFRILTGDIMPHNGDAFIGGYSVVRDVYQFQRYLGYCPQRDGLLDVLTGLETIELFSRLRGIVPAQEYLDALLEIFNFQEYADKLVGTYSAGNRRKLSLCLSMIGMPNVLLLDEPYAGMGAPSRKRIVNYISSLQRASKMSIVLSSHILSDVEFLCNRIAILGEGNLQCLGSLHHLKEKFGKGYTITVKTYPDRKQDFSYQRDVAHAVRKGFPEAQLVHSYEGLLEFRMSRVKIAWSELFSTMARIKKKFKLQDFYIADNSLEQIFLSVTRKEASAAAAAAAAAGPQTLLLPSGTIGI